jgi:hypothetical protein
LDEHEAAAALVVIGGVGHDWRVRVVVEYLDHQAAGHQAESERNPLDLAGACARPAVRAAGLDGVGDQFGYQ